ncbi:G patch domain-containing protein 3 [Microcaecilia unicolor]|uniref:G patch domain-containing protein 3 n=1 Tax=Microcaecilia unicolor TaxID=1415580 RepID=A0A6P7Z9S1_9AMPH|nr:G patch domain-containing protein 3 [Microcaecilia unicolor]
MAAPSGVVYCAVGNIPARFRSAQLRNYFSQLVESDGLVCFHYRHRPERRPGSPEVGGTCCCLVAVRPGREQQLFRMYAGKRWVDEEGNGLPSRCVILRIRVSLDTDPCTFPYKTKKQLQSKKATSETFTQADLGRMPELNPPALMPQGNVGTPVKVFLELIQACRLPPSIIKKLALKFPKTGSSRRYGNVPFSYQDSETVQQEDLVYTATGEEISRGKEPHSEFKEQKQTDPMRQEDRVNSGNESHSDDDDDRCEEWERHEALHEDVTVQERTKERLFEEEIELKWEKGGSGLVFYTDAQYWQEEQGDFDEQTADDWDVDMSIYYDQDAGDKDARDFLQMRLEQKRREGLEPLGTFEQYTKGIGRKLMERQGWTEGLGLGSKGSGMAEALDNEGQNPRCRHGLGYHGERLQTFHTAKKLRRNNGILISTVYDDPYDVDGGDTVLRRQPASSMKYRQGFPFVRSSDTDKWTPLVACVQEDCSSRSDT